MAATGKTPILLYGSTTATNTPAAGNLTNSSDGCEIAINVADKNLFFKDSTNAVNTVPIRQSSASSDGWLSSTDWSTFDNKQATLVSGTNIKTVSGTSLLGSGDLGTIGTGYGGTGLTSFTSSGIVYASSTSALTTDSTLTYGGNTVTLTPSTNTNGSSFRNTNAGGTFGFYLDNSTGSGFGNAYGGAIYHSGNYPITFWTNGTQQMYLSNAGQLGIGKLPSGNFILDVGNSSSAYGRGSLLNTVSIGTSGGDYPYVGYNFRTTSTGGTYNYNVGDYASAVYFTAGQVQIVTTTSSGTGGNPITWTSGPYVARGGTSWTNSSDERKKEVIEPITDGLNKLKQLRTVIGRFKTDAEDKRRSFLIAQDVLKVLPEAVDTTDEESLGVQYTDVIPLVIAAINELSDKFETYVASHK